MDAKNVWVVAFAFLLVGSAFGQTSPRRDSIEVAVELEVGMASTANLTYEINRAYRQVCVDYPALEQIDTVYVDSTDGSAVLPANFIRMRSVELLVSTGGLKRLSPLASISQDSVYRRVTKEYANRTDPKGLNYYDVENRVMACYPKWANPDDSAAIRISYYGLGTYLTTASDTIEVTQDYRNAVFYYACAEAQSRRGRKNEATYYREVCWSLYGPPDKQERVSR